MDKQQLDALEALHRAATRHGEMVTVQEIHALEDAAVAALPALLAIAREHERLRQDSQIADAYEGMLNVIQSIVGGDEGDQIIEEVRLLKERCDAAQRDLAAAREEVWRLRRLEDSARRIVEEAPKAADFEEGGRYDYDSSCGNSGDMASRASAREHYSIANVLSTHISPTPGA